MTKHGTEASWQPPRNCRCELCVAAHRRFRIKRGQLLRARGVPARVLVPATAALEHIETLRSNGWSVADIAFHLDVPDSNIWLLRKNPSAHISQTREERILALPLTPPPSRYTVLACGTRRRVQAMVWMGYTLAEIAFMSGISRAPIREVLSGERERVRITTAASIRKTFNRVIALPAPEGHAANRSRKRARRNDWHGPGAWANIDNPRCKPERGRGAEDD